MLAEKAKSYYLDENYNCAEAFLMAANDVYNLGLSKANIKLVSGFGTGMGCGNTCCTLSSIISATGQIVVQEKAHDHENFKEICAAIVNDFEKEFNSTICDNLSAKYKKSDERRCSEVVFRAAQVAQKHLDKLTGKKVKTSSEEGCTLSPDDIKRAKALGFLHAKGTNNFNARIITRNGKITSEENQCISEAAALFGNGELAMTTRLTIEVQGVPYENIEAFQNYISKVGLETGGTGSMVRPIVACKGTTCQYGLLDTYGLSEQIHYKFYKGYRGVKLPHKFKIAVGGCPNNCVKPDLNDVGIIGQRIPNYNEEMCRGCAKCSIETACPIKVASVKNGKLIIDTDACNHCGRCIGKCYFNAIEDGTYGYKIAIGGRWGKKVAQGKSLNKIFTSEEEVINTVEKIILLFREQGITGERLSDTIERIGFKKFEEMILSDDILDRKSEILGAQMHLVGGATC